MSEEMDAAGDELEARIPGLRVLGMGGMCPFQAEGNTPSGDEFYFRYRHDEATLYVFPSGTDHLQAHLYAELFPAMDVHDGGALSGPDAVELFMRLWGQLRPRGEVESTGAERLAEAVEQMVFAMRLEKRLSGEQ